MINRLHVRNFKSLHDLSVVLGGLNILIGRNEAGKSNILDALALLKGLMRFSLMPNIAEDPIATRGGYRDVVWRGEDKEPITIGIEGHLSGSPFEYTVRIELAVNDWVVTDEILTTPPEQPAQLRSSPTNWTYKGSSGGINGNQLALVRIQNESALAKQLSQSISTWSFYQLSPELMSHPNETIPVRRLDDDGANLSALIHTLLGERDPSLEAIEENVKAFSSDVEKIIAPVNESNRTYVAVRERGLWRPIPAWAMSHGTLFFLGLTAALFGPDTADLITLEEPDAYAHAHLLEVIGEMLQTAANKRQIIATTHRPYLLDYLPRDSITVIEKAKGATKCVRPKDKRRYLKAMKELGASKAWYSGHIGGIP
ncbi:AAA family ATPase [Chloroflexota bacterium]